MKHGKTGRAEGKGKEAGHNQKQQGIVGQQRQVQGRAAHLQIAGRQKGDKDAQSENQDICSEKISADNPRISKKCRQNKKHSQNHAQHPGGQKAAGDLEKHDDFKERVDKHWKEQQLQMLPDRFADRSKQGDERIFSAPFVAKVKQGACDQSKQDSGKQIGSFSDFHVKFLLSFYSYISDLLHEILRKYDIYYIICNKDEMIVEKKNRKRQ